MKKLVFIPAFVLTVSLGFFTNQSLASTTVSQLVAELRTSVVDSQASDFGKDEINDILSQCASQSTTQGVCSCLNENLPSKAHKLVNRCDSLSSN